MDLPFAVKPIASVISTPCTAGKTKGSSSACSVHAGTCIVSTALQQELQQQLLSEARQAAETAQQQTKAASKASPVYESSAGQASKLNNAKLGEYMYCKLGGCHDSKCVLGLVWRLAPRYFS